MRARITILAAIALSMMTTAAFAEKLKIAIPQKGFWDSEFVEFAQKLGMFEKVGLEVEIFWTQGGSETLNAAISGSADIAMSDGTLGVVGAYFKGAPVRIISAEMTGVHEVFWYVKADSPIKTVKDLAGKTVAFSRPGSSTNLMLLNLLKEYNVEGAKPTSTGGVPATRTQVMSGQIDVGWSVAPFNVQEVTEGKIRVVVKAGDIKGMQGQTIRVNVANLEVAEDQARGDHQVHEGRLRGDRLGLFRQAGGLQDVRRNRQGVARGRQKDGRRFLPEVGAAARQDRRLAEDAR